MHQDFQFALVALQGIRPPGNGLEAGGQRGIGLAGLQIRPGQQAEDGRGNVGTAGDFGQQGDGSFGMMLVEKPLGDLAGGLFVAGIRHDGVVEFLHRLFVLAAGLEAFPGGEMGQGLGVAFAEGQGLHRLLLLFRGLVGGQRHWWTAAGGALVCGRGGLARRDGWRNRTKAPPAQARNKADGQIFMR